MDFKLRPWLIGRPSLVLFYNESWMLFITLHEKMNLLGFIE